MIIDNMIYNWIADVRAEMEREANNVQLQIGLEARKSKSDPFDAAFDNVPLLEAELNKFYDRHRWLDSQPEIKNRLSPTALSLLEQVLEEMGRITGDLEAISRAELKGSWDESFRI